jgi:hypothetical protein
MACVQVYGTINEFQQPANNFYRCKDNRWCKYRECGSVFIECSYITSYRNFFFFSNRYLAGQYSHHIEREGYCSAYDHNCIHDVPNFSQIAAWMKYYARIYHLKSHGPRGGAYNHPSYLFPLFSYNQRVLVRCSNYWDTIDGFGRHFVN